MADAGDIVAGVLTCRAGLWHLAHLVTPLYEFYGYSEPCLGVQSQLDEAKGASVQISELHKHLLLLLQKFSSCSFYTLSKIDATNELCKKELTPRKKKRLAAQHSGRRYGDAAIKTQRAALF